MPKPKDNSNLTELIKGGLLGTALFIILTLIICSLLLKTDLGKDTYFPFLMLVSALSGIFSGFSAARKKRENGLINGLTASIVPAIIILIAMSLAYKSFSVFELIVAACCLFGGIIGGIAAVNIKKKRKPIKKR
ncbi:MAG: TIGR04086 family membrane protein [Clostridia bacterium]|nr:TIGR04086 family membrane protein [Clostridia bacterium]